MFILGIVKKLTEKRIREFLKKERNIISRERLFPYLYMFTCEYSIKHLVTFLTKIEKKREVLFF